MIEDTMFDNDFYAVFLEYGGFITTDDMLDFGYESVEDLAVDFAECLKNNMRGDDHA